MRIIALLLAALLLFGCNGGGQPPAENQTNQTEEKPPVQIIVEEQKNQTTEKNETEVPVEPPEEVPEGLQYESTPDANLGVFFIDVGGPGLHGDAILIKKGDLDVLVDAGPAEKSGKVVDFLHEHGVDDIEVLVSTNGDPRHYGGMDAVSDAFAIEELWWSNDTLDDPSYKAVAERMSAKARYVKEVEEGFTAELNGINFTALNPPTTDRFDDVNNDAIVMRLDDRNFSLLLTSGIQTGAQGRLINERKSDIQTQIIQAPYYGVGSGTSNIGLFLITAKPKMMVISGSSDESAANGGSRDPFKRLMTQYNISWRENYVNGTIRVTYDGEAYALQALGQGQ
jgi:competence protein ComEC